MRFFTSEHEWIDVESDTALFGITEYAVEQLGDITFVEMPEIGSTFNQNDVVCTIESVKAASDIYMPVSGEILEVNSKLDDEPELVNSSPEKDWLDRKNKTYKKK
jgi:glycine cleavage system H protein